MTQTDETYEELIQRAREEIRVRQMDRGEATARQALSLKPERAEAYNILALIRAFHGHFSEAMDLLRAGIAVEPGYRPAQENMMRLNSFPRQGELLLGDEKDRSEK